MIDDKKDLLNDFLEEERLKGSTPEVLKGLKYRIPKFFVFLESSDLILNLITPSIAGEYQKWLTETGRNDGIKYKANTIRSYLVAVSSFFNYLKRKGKIITNPFLDIRKNSPLTGREFICKMVLNNLPSLKTKRGEAIE